MNSYHQRLKKLHHLMEQAHCDAFVVDDPTDLFYLTGQDLSAGKLLVHKHGALLAVDNRYFEMCKKSSPVPVHLLVTNQSLFPLLLQPEFEFIQSFGVNSSHTTYRSYLDMMSEMDKINQSLSGRKIQLKPLENLVGKLRQIKGDEEIQILRAAAALGSEGFDYVLSLLQEGISEEEIAIELEIFWKRKGGRKVAFDPIIAFGAHSAIPHYRAGNARLKKGQNVLIDIGVMYNHYHSDMTRVVYFGKPDPKILEIHKIVQEAQAAALALCRPNTLIGDLDAAAREVISSRGYGEFFTHSLGHGVGLDIHEAPTLRDKPPFKEMPLQPGMVITIEPGIYLPGMGGARLEDTVVITGTGHENLTNRPTDPQSF